MNAKRLLIILCLLVPMASHAVPPRLLVQGQLTNLAGEGVDGTYALTVTLFAEPEAVTKLYKEVFAAVTLERGVFSLVLGVEEALDPAVFDLHDEVWVQLEVGGDVIGTPFPLASVAYALQAGRADLATRALGVLASSGAPLDCAEGTVGHTYLDTKDGRLHFCTAQGWEEFMGPQGLPGEPGPPGLPGDKGDTGAPGLKGDKGDKGDTGLQDLKGAKGDTGAQGIQGIQGIKGDTGLQGVKGDTGPAGQNGGLCYTRWGNWGCAAGYTEVVKGRPGGHEAYNAGGTMFGNVECVDDSATALESWTSGYDNRLMYGLSSGAGMVKVYSRCSVCCSGGCYTALGSSTCATGYTKVYSGRTGGVEAYQGGAIYGQTLCVDTTTNTQNTWTSGYNARLMRHREAAGGGSNGMDRVENVCAMCCKQ